MLEETNQDLPQGAVLPPSSGNLLFPKKIQRSVSLVNAGDIAHFRDRSPSVTNFKRQSSIRSSSGGSSFARQNSITSTERGRLRGFHGKLQKTKLCL